MENKEPPQSFYEMYRFLEKTIETMEEEHKHHNNDIDVGKTRKKQQFDYEVY